MILISPIPLELLFISSFSIALISIVVKLNIKIKLNIHVRAFLYLFNYYPSVIYLTTSIQPIIIPFNLIIFINLCKFSFLYLIKSFFFCKNAKNYIIDCFIIYYVVFYIPIKIAPITIHTIPHILILVIFSLRK